MGNALADCERTRARRRVAVLGSTGSIGVQTLDVARRHPDRIEVVALVAGTRAGELLAQAREFGVRHVAVGDERLAKESVADDLRAAGGQDDSLEK